MNNPNDSQLRLELFSWLDEQVARYGDVLPFKVLSIEFQFRGERVPLLGPQGIFKPRMLTIPLSITTAPNGPYDDSFDGDMLRYRYRGTDPGHRDNVGLREAMQTQTPLLYLHGVAKGRYVAAYPVYIVADHPERLTFTVAVDEGQALVNGTAAVAGSDAVAEVRRRYVTSTVQRRLHQQAFRERVLAAYRDQCALCQLRHRELLEAAHITPDHQATGEPVVSNGLSLCRLHHGAFDKGILGIRPDYVAEIRLDILEEVDGPMLRHGLQAMHGMRLQVPRSAQLRPDPDRLEQRYHEFRKFA